MHFLPRSPMMTALATLAVLTSAALGEAGLVRNNRLGRERIWELEPKRLERARTYLDQISTQWDEAIDRLKALVEREED